MILVIVLVFSRHVLTVSCLIPKTDALDKMVLSIKLSIYVAKSSGMSRLSIFLNTLFAIAWSVPCSAAGVVVSMAIASKNK